MKYTTLFANLLLVFGAGMGDDCSKTAATEKYPNLRFPAEWEPHNLTVMSFPGSKTVWGRSLAAVQKDVVAIVKAVARFEPVQLIVPRHAESNAKKLTSGIENVTFLSIENDDLWARDIVPVFLETTDSSGAKNVIGVNFRFNGWGLKQKDHGNDAKIAENLLKKFGMDCVRSPVVAEGGSFETDGEGTLLVTESSLVEKKRNPGKSKETIEKELKETLGVKKVIWFPGVQGKDITDAHVDCLARFAAPGVVVVNTPAAGTDPNDVWAKSSVEAMEILRNETDARGKSFKVVELQEPDPEKISYTGKSESFVTSYVNYLVVNGGVIMPKFGDAEMDEKARKTVQELYPQREIVLVQIDTLASGGGGIHCATHDMPA